MIRKNFIKYNQKCTRPFDLKELEKMQAMMENEDREDLAVYMQNIIKSIAIKKQRVKLIALLSVFYIVEGILI